MKRKMLSLLLIAGMVLFALTGCGDTETTDEEMIVAEETVEEKTEESTEGSVEENADVITEYYISVEATGFDDAMLLVTLSDEEGGTYVEETWSYGWSGESGITLGQIMEEKGIVFLDAVCEGQEFLGWVAHEPMNKVDANGFEGYTSVKLYDGKAFTTEEMMALEMPEGNITFYTAWDLICGGCEERKVCEVFYIEDDVYYVCDDCYEEFAHGMGLE